MSEKMEQALYFQESMLQTIKEEAGRLDRSLSWCVQRAWQISRALIAKLPTAVAGADELPSSPELDAALALLRKLHPDGDKRKQTLYFPEDMLAEIREHATRMDRSMSWVVQLSWCLAEDVIKALPAELED